MANPQTADQFMHLLKRSGLLSQEEVEALPWRYKLRDLESGKEIAKTLVRNNELTVFQARRILHGSSRGLRLGKYRVLDLLGSGGMGFVYLGQEDETDWKVALKVLSSRYRLDGGMKSRFQLEAEAGLKLRHPHIVRTHGIDKTEDIYGEIHYIAMEFIRGVSLFELIRLNNQLPWRQACDIIRQAALGLEFAHRHEMIHRDIKPENILIRSDGSAKLMDFGLAMLDKSEDEFAMAMIHGQTCLGTADYVAPEQIKDSFAVDHRADIYSLGCTLYFALSGRVPFPVKGETKAELTYLKLKCHRKAKPKPLASICGELPSRVIAIVETMMKKLPEKRIQNAAQVAKLLEPFCERSEIEFDWDRVLKQRWKEAQKRQRILEASRLKNLSDQRSPSASHSMSTGALPTKPLSLDDPQDIPPKEDKTQTSRETLVRDDTHVEKKKKEERKEPAKERLESLEQLERTQDPDENR